MDRPYIISDAAVHRAMACNKRWISPPTRGVRKISNHLLSPPSSSEASSSPDSSPDASPNNKVLEPFTSNTTVDVPLKLESTEALIFIGFCKDRAEDMYRRFSNSEYHTDLLEFAVACIDNNPGNAYDSTDHWLQAMDAHGLREDLQDALFNPIHDKIRLTHDLKFWIREILEINYWTLVGLNERLMRHLDIIENRIGLRGGAGGFEEEEQDLRVKPCPGDHVELWKAIAIDRIQDNLFEDGSIKLQDTSIVSSPCTDFSGWSNALYLTPSRTCQEYYANLLKDVCPLGDIRTLQVFLHNSYSKGLKTKTWNLRYGDRWRQLIYCSRTGRPYPDDWKKEYSHQELIIGPIAHGANIGFRKMKDWKQVEEKHVLDIDGTKPLQFVWPKHSSLHTLQLALEGKENLYNTLPELRLILKPWEDKSVSK